MKLWIRSREFGTPATSKAGRRMVRVEMRGVGHQLVDASTLRRRFCQDPVEQTKPAPADETVVEQHAYRQDYIRRNTCDLLPFFSALAMLSSLGAMPDPFPELSN